MKTEKRNSILLGASKKTLYFMTLFAFMAAGAAAYLTAPVTLDGTATVSAQRANPLAVGIRSGGERLTPEMLSYALGNRTNNLSDMISAISQLPCHEIADTELGGRSFDPGVYCLSSARLAGELKLNGQDDPNAIFIFNVKNSLLTERESKISLTGEARASNVFFVADTVNIGDNTDFRAAIMAKNSILLNENAKVFGTVKSLSGEVVGSPNAPEGGGNGTVEICKKVTSTIGNLENRIFFFRVTGVNIPTPITVSVRAGFCTAPFNVPNGPAVVTELNEGTRLNGEPVSGNFMLTSVRVIQASVPRRLQH